MQMIQHANEATKKMKNTFSYESENVFLFLKNHISQISEKFVSHQRLSLRNFHSADFAMKFLK